MLARNEIIFKWTLYSAAALLGVFVQTSVLQRITLWGVIPFLYPLLAAIPAVYEGPVSGTVFAIGVGVFCDLLLPGAAPCFYTLIFPLIGLCAGLLSRNWLSSGIFCSLVAGILAFLLTDLFRIFLLFVNNQATWAPALWVMVRELCITLPLTFLLSPLFRAVFRKTHLDD